MKKTSVYLSDAEVSRLIRLARSEKTTQADIIRRAIAAYVPPQFDRDFALIGSGRGPGGSVADVPDEELLKGFGE